MEVINAGNVTIKSHIDEVKNAAEIDILAWLDAMGEDAAETAAGKAPVDTGRLKNSIGHAVVADEHTVYIGTNVKNEEGKNYAIYHEFGTGVYAEQSNAKKIPWAYKDKKTGEWRYTKGVPAKHFLKFGVTAHKSAYKKALEQYLKGQA